MKERKERNELFRIWSSTEPRPRCCTVTAVSTRPCCPISVHSAPFSRATSTASSPYRTSVGESKIFIHIFISLFIATNNMYVGMYIMWNFQWIRRKMAPGWHEGAEAERLWRFYLGGGVFDWGKLHVTRKVTLTKSIFKCIF